MSKLTKKWFNLILSAGLLLTNTCGSTAPVMAIEDPLIIEEGNLNPELEISNEIVDATDEDKIKATLEYAEIQKKENPGFQFEYSKHVDKNDASFVNISLTIAIENEKINNVNVLLPNANVSDKLDVEYIAPCNGIYRFRIYYELNSIELYYDYYVNVEESDRMFEPNCLPDYSNGFISNEELTFNYAKMNLFSASSDGYREIPSGEMWVKLFVGSNGQVTVNGERLGDGGNGRYVAYMSDNMGNSLLCLEPGESASTDLERYEKEAYGINNTWPGKSEAETVEMALIWYYGSAWLPNNDAMGCSQEQWYLTTQLMIWKKMGFTIDSAPSYVPSLESKIMEKVRAYQTLLNQSYEEDKVYIKKRLPWDGTNSVINSKGELNPAFEYKLINVNAKGGTVINIGDPTYAWPISGKSDKDLIKEKVDVHPTAKVEDDCKAAAADGYAWNKDTKVCEKKTYLVETSNVQVIVQDSSSNRNDYATNWVNQSKNVQATYSYDGSSTFYNFRMVGELSDGSTAEMYDNDILSYTYQIADSASGDFWILRNPALQDLVSFAVPPLARKMRTFRFAYNPEGTPVTPDIPEKEPVQPPVIVIPDFNKYDNEGNDLTHDYADMPVQGAEFEFYSGGYFKMDWVMEKKVLTESVYTPPVPCTQTENGCVGGAPGYTTYYYEIQDPVPSSAGGKYKPANVFTERNHKFEGVDGVTDSDGFIDFYMLKSTDKPLKIG